MVLNPYATVNRLYTMKDEALRMRCTYSAKNDDDIFLYAKESSGNKMADQNLEFMKNTIPKVFPGISYCLDVKENVTKN